MYFLSIFLIFFFKSFILWCGIRNFLLVVRNKRYLRLIRRHRLIGPYYLLRIFLYIIYIRVNIVSLYLNIYLIKSAALSISFTILNKVTSRAGYLVLINLVPIYLLPYSYRLADLFDISIDIYKRMYRAIEGILITLCLLYIAMAIIYRLAIVSSSLVDVYRIIIS